MMDSNPIDKKFEAFNWHVIKIDGHDIPQLLAALALAAAAEPAEEAPGGAKKILATHALDGADLILGLHSSPLLDVGTIGIRSGAVTASVDKFGITFRGRGTHAAHPERGIDPIVMAASFVCAVQSVRGQNLDPAAAGLIGVTRIESGNTWNVIPETAFLEGTARSLTIADRLLIKKRIHELAAGIAAATTLAACGGAGGAGGGSGAGFTAARRGASAFTSPAPTTSTRSRWSRSARRSRTSTRARAASTPGATRATSTATV